MARRRRGYASVELTTMRVNGVACRVTVDSGGTFRSYAGGRSAKADTLAELETQLKRLTKQRKITVAVPVTILGRSWKEEKYQRSGWVSGKGVQHVTLVGLTVNGDVKARDDKTGEPLRADAFSRGWSDFKTTVRRLTDAEAEKYTELLTAYEAARTTLHDFIERRKLSDSLEGLVRDAIAQKIDTPDEPPEESEDPRER